MAEGFLGNLIVQITTDLTEFNQGLRQAEKDLRNTADKLMDLSSRVGRQLTVMGAAITATLGLTVKAASDAEVSWARSEQFIKNAGLSVDEVLPKIKAFAAEMQSLTGQNDELIGLFASRLIPITGNVGKAFELTRSALDLSASGLIDLEGATRLFINAADGNIGRLGMLVPALRNVTDEQLKQMSQSERLNFILGAINEQYGGQAKIVGETLAGKLNLFKNTIGDLAEIIGGQLIPIITNFLKDTLIPLVEKFKTFAEEHPILIRNLTLLIGAFGLLALIFGPILIFLPNIITSFTLLGTAFMMLIPQISALAASLLGLIFSPIMPIIGALAVLAAAWFNNWDNIQGFMRNVARNIGDAFDWIIEKFTKMVFTLANLADIPLKEKLLHPIESLKKAMAEADEQYRIMKESGEGLPNFGDKFADGVQKAIDKTQELKDMISGVEAPPEAPIGTPTAEEPENISIDESNQNRIDKERETSSILDGIREFFSNKELARIKTQTNIAISEAQRRHAIESSLTQSALSSLQSSLQQAAQHNKAAAIAFKAIQIGRAIINTSEAITEALPNLALATLIAAVGAAEIATIVGVEFAKGGIVTQPTLALIGEAGPEAVIPLNRGNAFGDIYINIESPIINRDIDIKELAERLGFEIESQLRYTRGI